MMKTFFRTVVVAATAVAGLSFGGSASANACDPSDPRQGVMGGNLCIAVETVSQSPGAPLIVILHGDMSSGKPPTYNKWFAQKVAGHVPDATIVAMLRPGYGNGAGKKSEGNTHGRKDHYTDTNIDAVAGAVRALAAHHMAARAILIGHSGGAATAGVIAGRHPGLLDGAVLISCPCDIKRWRLERNASSWPASLSPSDYIASIPADTVVLAVTGRNDDNTRPSLAKSFVSDLRKRGGNATFAEIDGVGHRLSSQFADRILPMIAKLAEAPTGP